MLTLLSSLALAQSQFTQDFGLVLDSSADPLVANGLGAPTLAYDPDDELFVMFFETLLDPSTAGGCSSGKWGIGVASSANGLDWDVWPTPVVTPTPGTPHACVAAHPAVLYENGTFHLWFKSEKGSTLPRNPAGPWAADNYSGVGYASVVVQLDDKAPDIAAIDAQIAQLESDLDAALDAAADLLDLYEADLLAQSDEFACQVGGPICSPCSGVTMSAAAASGTTTTTQAFCQPFSFSAPSTLNWTNINRPNDQVQLTWNPGAATTGYCRDKGVGGGGVAHTCTVVVDSTVTATALQFAATRQGGGLAYTVSGSVTLSATNAQTTTGPVLTDLTNLLVTTAALDADATALLLPGFITDLTALATWLGAGTPTADEAALRLETLQVRAGAAALANLITTTQSDLADLQAERAVLAAYVRQVTPTVSTSVVLPLNRTFGYPSVGKLGGQYVMLIQEYPDLYRASGATPTSFTLDPTPSLTANTVSWATTEVYEPSLLCGDAPFPYASWIAGRSLVGGVLSTAGASDTVSSDTVSWLLNATADFLWTSAADYRHFDVVTDTSGELRMYWVKRVNNRNEVWMKSTTSSWDPLDTRNRVCP